MRFGRVSCIVLPSLLSILLTLAAGCSDHPSLPNPPVREGEVVADTTIDASAGDAVVSVPGAISVTVPAGAAPAGTKLVIVRLDEEHVPPDGHFELSDAYDVTLSSGTTFDPPLRITLHYAAEAPSPSLPGLTGAAWYDPEVRTWIAYPDAVTDTLAHTVSFGTAHLTKLSRWSLSMYTDWTSTSHFNIYWVETGPNAPMADAVYAHKPAWHVGSDPDYIQDLARSLEDAYDAYKAAALTVHSGKVNVYVHQMSVNGEAKFLGYINISNQVQPIRGVGSRPTWEELQSTAAHEYLHYVQDYYYMWAVAGKVTTWWWEASAVNADRLVWPSRVWFEVEDYANNQVDDVMHRAWDDCNSDPSWYVAGGFVAYLTTYRTGTLASLPEMIRRGGNASLSYIRTELDTYLKTIGSAGIGREYADYLRWAYEGRGPVRLQRPDPGATGLGSDVSAILTNADRNRTVNQAFPRMSGRIAKIMLGEDTPLPHRLTVEGKKVPAGMEAWIYGVSSSGAVTFLYPLADGQTRELRLRRGNPGNGETRVDVLVLNAHKDNPLTPEINIAIDKQVSLPVNLNEKVDGRVLNFHGNEVHARVNGTITGPEPVAITGTRVDVSDIAFEFPSRTLTAILSPGAFQGVMQNFSISFTEPGETVIDSLATKGWKWEWLGYTGGRLSLHRADNDAWEHPTFTGSSASASGVYWMWGLEAVCSARTMYTWVSGGETESAERIYSFKVTFYNQ